MLCRREPFALLGHGGLGGLLLDLPQGGIQGAADLGQALLFAGELRFGDRLGDLGIDAIQHLLGLGQPFALGIHHCMIGLGGQGAGGGVQFLVDLGKTGLGLVAQRPHHIHFNLAGAGINRENGIAKIAHFTLYTVNLAVQLVLLQDCADPHLSQAVLLVAQQAFGLCRPLIERGQGRPQPSQLPIDHRHSLGNRRDRLAQVGELALDQLQFANDVWDRLVNDVRDLLDGLAQLLAQVFATDLPIQDVENRGGVVGGFPAGRKQTRFAVGVDGPQPHVIGGVWLQPLKRHECTQARIGGLGLHLGQGQLHFAPPPFAEGAVGLATGEHRAEGQGPVACLNLDPHGDSGHLDGEIDRRNRRRGAGHGDGADLAHVVSGRQAIHPARLPRHLGSQHHHRGLAGVKALDDHLVVGDGADVAPGQHALDHLANLFHFIPELIRHGYTARG